VTVQKIQAESWLHLNELLFQNSWQPSIKRHRSEFAFRGVEDKDYPLSTSLIRLGKKDPEHGPQLETAILRSFKQYAYNDDTRSYSLWYWLTLAQHHGLPTRLMDWTASPLVALHFVTRDLDKHTVDGAVWCVNVDDTRRNDLPKNFWDKLIEQYAHYFTTDMLDDLIPTLKDLKRLEQQSDNFVIFFEPPSLDQRIVNQYALFSVMPDSKALMDDWLITQNGTHRKIIIPKQLKWEIRSKLDQMNITERVLFPGLDGLSSWLKRYYSHYPEGAQNTENMKFPPT